MLKFFLYAALAYLLLRAASNLVRAMSRQGVRSGQRSPRDGHSRAKEERRATRLREEEDVEDARWEDL